MTAALRFDLTDSEPARPRTITQGYRFPPARPDVPRAELCTREQLLDLAAGAANHDDQLWSLLGSSTHVRAICRLLVEHIEPESRAADEQIRALQVELAAAQSKAAASERLLERTERVVVTLCHDLYATQRALKAEQDAVRQAACREGHGHE